MSTTKPLHDLLSVGKLCELLQTTPGKIQRAADAANVQPYLRLNGVSYFTDDDMAIIRGQLSGAK